MNRNLEKSMIQRNRVSLSQIHPSKSSLREGLGGSWERAREHGADCQAIDGCYFSKSIVVNGNGEIVCSVVVGVGTIGGGPIITHIQSLVVLTQIAIACAVHHYTVAVRPSNHKARVVTRFVNHTPLAFVHQFTKFLESGHTPIAAPMLAHDVGLGRDGSFRVVVGVARCDITNRIAIAHQRACHNQALVIATEVERSPLHTQP